MSEIEQTEPDSSESDGATPPQQVDPTDGATCEAESSLLAKLTYGLSLPERTARAVSVMVGGLANESAARLIPAAFRSSRSYRVFVQQALDMMIHDVGGAKNPNVQAAGAQETHLCKKQWEVCWTWRRCHAASVADDCLGNLQ